MAKNHHHSPAQRICGHVGIHIFHYSGRKVCIPVMLTLSSRDCGPFMLEILTILSSDCDPPR